MPLPPLPPEASKFERTQRSPRTWKAPAAWESNTADESDASSFASDEEEDEEDEDEEEDWIMPNENDEDNAVALDLMCMQREIKKMAAATHSTMYQRIAEPLANIRDPAMREEMTKEKQRWMLAAIHKLDVLTPDEEARAILARRILPKVNKVMALFESQGQSLSVVPSASVHTDGVCYRNCVIPGVAPELCPSVSSLA